MWMKVILKNTLQRFVICSASLSLSLCLSLCLSLLSLSPLPFLPSLPLFSPSLLSLSSLPLFSPSLLSLSSLPLFSPSILSLSSLPLFSPSILSLYSLPLFSPSLHDLESTGNNVVQHKTRNENETMRVREWRERREGEGERGGFSLEIK
jgi:hypothetical protein